MCETSRRWSPKGLCVARSPATAQNGAPNWRVDRVRVASARDSEGASACMTAAMTGGRARTCDIYFFVAPLMALLPRPRTVFWLACFFGFVSIGFGRPLISGFFSPIAASSRLSVNSTTSDRDKMRAGIVDIGKRAGSDRRCEGTRTMTEPINIAYLLGLALEFDPDAEIIDADADSAAPSSFQSKSAKCSRRRWLNCGSMTAA